LEKLGKDFPGHIFVFAKIPKRGDLI